MVRPGKQFAIRPRMKLIVKQSFELVGWSALSFAIAFFASSRFATDSAPDDIPAGSAQPASRAEPAVVVPAAPDRAVPDAASERSMAQRDAGWRERILLAAEIDLEEALRLFDEMPVTDNDHPREQLLGEVFARHGAPALTIALKRGIPLWLCANALKKSPVTESLPFIHEFASKVEAEARHFSEFELRSLVEFIGKGSVADVNDAWSVVSRSIDLGNLNWDMAKSLGASGDPLLTGLILDSLPRDWDKSRVRQAALEVMAKKRGYSNANREEIEKLLGSEPGVSQVRRFSSSTAIRIALTGNEAGSLEWAGGLTDPVKREAAISGALSYLGSMSSLRALRLVVSDPELRGNAALLDAAVAAVGDSLGDRDSRDLEALRNLAATDPAVFEILEQKGLERVLQQASEK